MTNLRVIKVLDSFGTKTEEVYWDGSDVGELSQRYPPSEILGADPLGPHNIEDGWINWHFRFEVQQEDGSWVECKDPRRRLHAELTELERAIDAENRSRFPGDYVDEEDEYDPYSGYYDYDEEF